MKEQEEIVNVDDKENFNEKINLHSDVHDNNTNLDGVD